MARLAYLGTPETAVPPLRALVDAGHDVALCITQPDRRRGRGGETTPSALKVAAVELGIPVSHDLTEVTGVGAELGVVVAYGRIIPGPVLARLPMVNLHFSLLPRWRGAAPVERAILAGDTETGVCLMKVEEGLDSGPVYLERAVPLDERITLGALRTLLVGVGSALVVEGLVGGLAGLPVPRPQVGEVTLAAKVTSEDLHLDWSQPAGRVHRVVRLGRAWTTFRGRRVRVLAATPSPSSQGGPPGTLHGTAVSTGAGDLVLEQVQPESRSPMSAEAWVRGLHVAPGDRLGTD
jgi:methionyl-tRNA formyltransferase